MGAKPAASKPAASGDKVTAAYQDLLKEIVEKKKLASEIRKRPPKKRPRAIVKAVLAVLLPPFAAAVWIFNPFAPAPPAPPRVPDEIMAWQTALIDAALTLREWKDSAGYFPADIQAAGVMMHGVTFTVDGDDSFVLKTFTTEGVVTVWMEGETLGTGPKPVAADPALEPAPLP